MAVWIGEGHRLLAVRPAAYLSMRHNAACCQMLMHRSRIPGRQTEQRSGSVAEQLLAMKHKLRLDSGIASLEHAIRVQAFRGWVVV